MDTIKELLLPEDKIIKRFKNVFDAFKNNISAVIVGLPQTSKSVIINTLYEYNTSVFKKLCGDYVINCIFVEIYSGDNDNKSFMNYLVSQFLSLKDIPGINVKNLEKHIINGNMNLAIIELKNIVNSLPPRNIIAMFIYDIDDYTDKYPGFIKSFQKLQKQIWSINTPLVFCFTGEPAMLNNVEIGLSQILPHQKTFYHQLFDKEEMDYSRYRLEKIQNLVLPDDVYEKICSLAGGHYFLYKIIAMEYINGMKNLNIETIKGNRNINEILKRTQKAINDCIEQNEKVGKEILDKMKVLQDGNYVSPLLPIELNKEEMQNNKNFNNLSGQELIVFEYLKKNNKRIVLKEEIAKLIWGKDWVDNYSEQAIDKTISRIKKQLKGSEFKVAVLRNRGIKLIEL